VTKQEKNGNTLLRDKLDMYEQGSQKHANDEPCHPKIQG
jgi:hypothetical protein